MMYEVILTDRFVDDMNFYKRKKKYTKIEDDVEEVVKELEVGNLIGDEIKELKLPVGQSTFKVRAANTSAKVGKSNGFRIIYYAIKDDCEVYLLTIYSKKDQEDITNEDIKDIIKRYCIE